MSKAKRLVKESADGTGLRYSLEDMVPRRDEQAGSRSFGNGEFLKPIGAFLIDGSNKRIATPSGRKHGFAAVFEAPSPGESYLAGTKTHFRPCLRCQMKCDSTNWQSLISTVVSNSVLIKKSPPISETARALRMCLSQYGVEEIDEVVESIPDTFGAWIVGESVVRSPDSDVVSIHMVDSATQGGCFFLLSNVSRHQDFEEQLEEMSQHLKTEQTTDSFFNFALAAQDPDISDNLHNRTACDLIQSGMFRIEVVFGVDPQHLWRHVPAGPGFCIVLGVCSDNSLHVLFDAKSDVLPKWGSAELSAFALFLITGRSTDIRVSKRIPEETTTCVKQEFEEAASIPEVVECSVCVPTPALAARNVDISLKSPLSLFTSKEYLAQTQTQTSPAKRTRQRSSANLAGTGSMVASITIQNKSGKKEPIAERVDDLNSNVFTGEKYTTIRNERIPLVCSAQDGDDILFLGLKVDKPPVPGAVTTPQPPKGPSRKSTPSIEPVVVKEDPPSPAAVLQAEIDLERRKAAQKGQAWRPLKLWLSTQSSRALCDRYLNAPVPIMLAFQCSIKQLYLFHVALCLSFGESSVIHEAVPSVYFADSLSQFKGKQTLTLRRCLEAAEIGGKVPFFAAQDALQEVVEIFQKEEEIQRTWGGENVTLGDSTVMLVRSPVQQRRSVNMAVTASTTSSVHAEYSVVPAASGVFINGTALVANEGLKDSFMDALDKLSKLNKAFC